MDFTPQHAHPFSVADAATLDVGTIVAEITRLQNSLAHLATSQSELLSFLAEEEDADLRAAWKENEGVIASQRERIVLLRHILISKVGEDSLGHYGISVTDEPEGVKGTGARVDADSGAGAGGAGGPTPGTATGAAASAGDVNPAEQDEGLHL